VQWLRDNLKLIGSSAEVEALAAGVPDSGGVVLVPAFVRTGRAALGPARFRIAIGLNRGTTPGTHCAGGSGEHRLPVADVLGGRTERDRHTAGGAQSGWRRGGETSLMQSRPTCWCAVVVAR